MAKSPTEQIAELRSENSVLREDLAIVRERLETLLRDFKELQAERKSDANEQKQQAQLNAVLSQRLDDHLKRVETWSGRLWTLVTVLVGAIMSLASGLIVALAKK